MKKNKICQSCGMPLKHDPQQGGTNADGSRSDVYCSYCYAEGKFTDECNDVREFQEHCRQIMMKGGHNRIMAWLFTRGMKRLERWKEGEKA
ncbi:zinc ribbon domain-containing protein [Prevotella corporis]|uniref:zinc ribbon domain-containing protein n=1 Tax=Prevotella corporis TaxID=28128 RepID=UPI0023F7FBFF|nr:zinc ribbon domain-containing protein [Prevotella corporis]